MRIIIGLCIFCLVLFLYLHIQFHLKTGEDLEMYEVEHPSKDKLEEICDLRQPVLFDFECQKIIETSNRSYVANNYHAFEVKIRNIKENDNNTELYMPLPIHSAVKLFDEDNFQKAMDENTRIKKEFTAKIKFLLALIKNEEIYAIYKDFELNEAKFSSTQLLFEGHQVEVDFFKTLSERVSENLNQLKIKLVGYAMYRNKIQYRK